MPASNAIIDLRGDGVPPDVAVIRYQAREALSRPFEVDVEFATADPAFDGDALLGQPLLLTVIDDAGGQRLFHGIVEQLSYAFFTGTHHHFRARLAPELAALAHRENSKIWQDKTIIDVVREVFAEAGACADAEFVLAATYLPREMIVQYRESELAFVSRLFEEAGIFYFFRHTPDGHKLVVADDVAAFAPADDAPEVTFAMSQGGVGSEPLADFRRRRALRTTRVRLRDYDFEKPQLKPEAEVPASDAWSQPYYEYPGRFIPAATGQRHATARLSSLRGDADVATGSSRAIGLRCGVPFSTEGAAQDALNGEFVVVELETEGEQTRDSGGPNRVCENRFSAIPKGAPWAPRRTTPRPVIRGVQTALVTGPSGDAQAIHVDKYGRIKVRFRWDRIGQLDGTSSCWLRVAQSANGGAVALPRIGWEVIVAFHEGNPDRPFALGRVYNGEKVPPAGLPGAKATGGLKTYSTPGGAGINELNLGDAGGSQGFTLRAQKDLNVVVEHDKTEKVGVDSTHVVKVNHDVNVGANHSTSVSGDASDSVGSVRSNNVGGNQTIDVGGNETSNATSNMLEKIGGDRSYTVGGNMIVVDNTVMQTVAGNLTRTVGAVQLDAAIGSITDEIGGAFSETVGAIQVDATAGEHSQTIGGNKDATSLAAELHVLGGGLASDVGGSLTGLVGGLRYEKLGGDYSVKASSVLLIGAMGMWKGGGSELKLGGGPVVVKGSKISTKGALVLRMSGAMKMG